MDFEPDTRQGMDFTTDTRQGMNFLPLNSLRKMRGDEIYRENRQLVGVEKKAPRPGFEPATSNPLSPTPSRLSLPGKSEADFRPA